MWFGFLASSLILSQVAAQYASTFPSFIPLVQRSPHFGSWIAANESLGTPANQWPITWTNRILGWQGFVRVDGSSWQWQGRQGGELARTLGAYITPTRTIFTIEAGPVQFNVTYLSPIEPSDWVLQSFPFAYVFIDAWSTDGNAHDVQFYSDVTGEFISGELANTVQWNTMQTQTSLYHQMKRTTATPMTENNNLSEDGMLHFAAELASPGLTYQTGPAGEMRSQFISNGRLANTQDSDFRAIRSNWPVLAIAMDLGSITQTSTPVVWAIGLLRDPVIRYVRDAGIESRTSYFWTKYQSIGDAVSTLSSLSVLREAELAQLDAFIADFPSARNRAEAFDMKIMSAASAVSQQYADLVALNLRQTMAALEITTAKRPSGEWNASDVKIFMRDTGNSRRVNPVEMVYAALPALLYLNASLAGLVLDPMLEYQASPQHLNNYAAPDLGSTYPDATGNSTNQVLLAVENCGSMLVMALAHAQKSGEGGLINQHYTLLREWADYLVSNTLQPTAYTTADGLAGATSNLALKGIVGIYAMSKINEALEQQGALSNYTEHYRDTATRYARDWESLAVSGDHIGSSYGNPSPWGLVFNLFAPRLLNTTLISESIYDTQAAWYASQAVSAPAFGFQYDGNDPKRVKTHWTLLTAASVAKSPVKDTLISMVHNRILIARAGSPNPTTYNSDTGATSVIGGRASPAQGAILGLLALNLPDQTITFPKEEETVDVDVATIAGGVVGGVSGVLLLVLAVWFYRRRRRQIKEGKFKMAAPSSATPGLPTESSFVTPFMTTIPDASVATSPSEGYVGKRGPLGYTNQDSSSTGTNTPGWSLKVAGNIAAGSSSQVALTANRSGPSVDGESIYTSQVGSSMSGDLSLRQEVEQLRREMALLRNQQMEPVQDEPPPMYVPGVLQERTSTLGPSNTAPRK
ncbi:unnamed protein product [Cyclocybe aegerita]|uniref:DUF1793-domain-containing protein n=1 Tax=Cyclocybe aegerita TaxID=1973307 RepID=A0A8S0VXW6_CYCAE|nr:unnamed protein product [Cyclocybe aegerita]